MGASIFSTYSTGENRVTASILAVLRSLSLGRIERLLGALMEEPNFQLVRFENQHAKGGGSVPDALISSSCRLLVETKTKRSAVNGRQIARHLKKLSASAETTQALLVLSPDEAKPKVLDQFEDQPVMWASFALLDQAIDELLKDEREVVSEREAFLLRELQMMMLEEKLVGSASDVLVVPARSAWPEYKRYYAYVCQPNRTFQPVQRIAFYTSNQIYPLVPEIDETIESVQFNPGAHKGRLGQLIHDLLRDTPRHEEAPYKVLFLSPPDDDRTVHLDAPIINDLKSEKGRTIAFTQNQRYVSLERLRKARTTSELVGE